MLLNLRRLQKSSLLALAAAPLVLASCSVSPVSLGSAGAGRSGAGSGGQNSASGGAASSGAGAGGQNSASGGAASSCAKADCGPALGLLNYTCADGTIAGPTGRCIEREPGVCSWEIAVCNTTGAAGDGAAGNGGAGAGPGNGAGTGGANSRAGAGGGGGAMAGADSGPALGCEHPVPFHVSNGPQTSPDDTGFDLCDAFWGARRRVARACPLGPLTADPHQCEPSVCSSDQDCTRSAHGLCADSHHLAGYCGCYYGCMQDSDCGPGSVCFCGDPVGRCVPSNCTDDSACGSGQLCASYLAACIPGTGPDAACTGGVNGCFSGFACQNAADECLHDADCLPNNARCELQNGHRVCAPECPGPPHP